MRAPKIVACLVPALLAMAACSSSSDSPAYPDAPALGFTQVLGLVPAGVTGPVSYTDWSALDHRVTGFSLSTTTASRVRDADAYRSAVGVGPADSAWQVDFGIGRDGSETITQWTDGAGLAHLVGSLTSHGWKKSTRGSWQALTRTEPITDIGWTWANHTDFLLDDDHGVLVQYTRGETVLVPGTRSVLDLPGVRAAVAQTPSPVTGQIRAGTAACPHYGLKERSPAPPESFVLRYFEAVGTLGPTVALSVAVTRPDGLAGAVAVTLGSAAQAAAELPMRQDAAQRLAGGNADFAVARGRTVGAVDTFTLGSGRALVLTDLVEHGDLGADSCGVR